MPPTVAPGVTELLHDASWAALRSTQVGRLAVLVDGQPDIFPVNFAVDHGTIVIRSGPGTKLAAAAAGAFVAFEADGYEPAAGEAWSVVLKGRVELVQAMQEMVDVVAVPLFPWHAEPKPCFVRIVPHSVTGRRFVVADPSRWREAAYDPS
jgi:nitroimidazol reductase NimA-like FMN-containing flavoprotein (pyridoxamine 5'-phosphate oxidase superfamily)